MRQRFLIHISFDCVFAGQEDFIKIASLIITFVDQISEVSSELSSVYLKIALEVVFAFRGCISRIWRGILANLARSRFEICTFSVRYRETSDIFAKENEEEGKTGFDTKQAQ